jgi:DNA-binding transcriptional LysR family regulator
VTAAALAKEKLILGEKGGNTRRLIDQFFAESGEHPIIKMELSRLAAIKRMVEAEMGIGIVPSHSTREEIKSGQLVAWWIEGARINWELGLAKLRGGYDSPVSRTFIKLCRQFFNSESQAASTRRKTPHATVKRKRVSS